MRTFTIIKPDAVADGNEGKIIDMIIASGLRLSAMRLVRMSIEDARRFYSIHRDKPFYDTLTKWMSSAAVIVAVFEGENAVERLRATVGATDPARAAEGTVRRLFGHDITHNAIHASDSEENANIEAAQFFKREDYV